MTRRPLLLSFTAGLLILAGCGGDSQPPAGAPPIGGGGGQSGAVGTPPPTKGTIGLSVLTLTNPFFGVIGDSLRAEAKKHGYEVEIVAGEFSADKQQAQIKDFIVKKVAAIVLTPCDSKAVGPAIKEANDAGIPVFTADIKCTAPDAKVVTHVATDNYGGGKEAGSAMIEALGDTGGKIVILDFNQVESCQQRVKGFRETIDAHNKGRSSGKIQIVATLPGGGQKGSGQLTTEDALQAHADLVGIFAINDPSALGARAALEKAGKADQVKIIGFDGQPEGKQAIKDGRIYADPIQFPDQIGTETMMAIVKHFNGEKTEPEKLIPTKLYRKEDGQKDTSLK